MTYPNDDAKRLGIVVPSTNITVERDFHGFHVPEVSHHVARIHVPDMAIESDEDFTKLIELAREATLDAVDRVMTAQPHRLVLGISSETVWDGKAGCDRLRGEFEARVGCPVTLGADACVEALNHFDAVRSIAILTPYTPAADARTKAFFEEMGFIVRRIEGFQCTSPTQIAAVTPDAMTAAVARLDGEDVDAILQFGTNLPFAPLAGALEQSLGKPVVAVNAAIYRHALRHDGIDRPVDGYGRVLSDA